LLNGVQVANYWESSRWEVDLSGLRQRIDPDENLTTEEFCELVGCKGFEESDEFAEGFAHGAQEVYEEVAAEMEKQAEARGNNRDSPAGRKGSPEKDPD
jgi:hypothetical protein